MTSGGFRDKIQPHAFSYFKVLSLFTGFVIVVIELTAVFPVRGDELKFVRNFRV